MSIFQIQAISRQSLLATDMAKAIVLLEEACAYDTITPIAEEKLFGSDASGHKLTTLAARIESRFIALASVSGPWIRILAVHPKYRKQGVGSALLKACESQIEKKHTTLRAMDQPGNYLSPGIDVRNDQVISWLEKRGYQRSGKASNLLISVQGNPKVTTHAYQERIKKVHSEGYRIQRLQSSQTKTLAQDIQNRFSLGWAYELQRAATLRPLAVHIAVENKTGQVTAFAVHDGNNQGSGSFGPTGTWEEHRGKGLGAALLLACLLDIQAAGHSHAQVAWIGPREFYDKVAGIDSHRDFVTMSKPRRHLETSLPKAPQQGTTSHD